ncbi:MFS transporter [Sphingobacterium sp. T2]|nr:MFS transporter [Sphingobacterium sp. T2]
MEKFQWDERMVGLSLGFVGTLLMIVQAGLIRIAIPKLGLKNAILLGLTLYLIAYSLFGIATQSWMMFAISIFFVSAGIGGPALQSYISNHIPANEQGQIQGGITSVISLTAIIGPVIMSSLFSYFSRKEAVFYFPGAPFVLSALLSVLALLIMISYFRNKE